jgi:hypothetical protein
VVVSLDTTGTVTVSAATGLPLKEAFRSKLYSKFRKGEPSTEVTERVLVVTYDPK